MTTTIPLNNGVTLPSVGYGVFQTPPDETASAVTTALEAGYRMIDTAAAYGNESGVGEALRRADLTRDDVFLETKAWITDYGYDSTLHAFEKASAKLGVEQIDLFILHQPLNGDEETYALEAYRALETLYADGKVRAIGVSNFLPHHLDRLLDERDIVPAVNQIEVHPYFRNSELLTKHQELGIVSQAWSPLGGITFYPGWGDDARRSTLADPTIGEIALAHGVTAAQVMLRWHVQQGRQVIPKSVTPARIAQNLDVFGFTLSDAELAQIDALDTGVRGGPDPAANTRENRYREIPEA
ncbi:MAG: aldo/keto reductase [Demequina sp.]|uniref:aldo/keto reductase n=1 Tax=Demequina sp. TaxID=2050685 RepID=UPI003A889A9D